MTYTIPTYGVCRVSDQPLEDHRPGKDGLAQASLKCDLVLAGLGCYILGRFLNNTICLWLTFYRVLNLSGATPTMVAEVFYFVDQGFDRGFIVRSKANLGIP